MNKYILKQGETINDAILNSTGNVLFLNDVLTLNNFDNWTPTLIAGYPVLISDELIDQVIVDQLTNYPACNEQIDYSGLIDSELSTLESSEIVNTDSLPVTSVKENTSHKVKQGESITDVVLNSTGNLPYWNALLTENSQEDWTPSLSVDQKIFIPSGLTLDQNTTRQLELYPACNMVDSSIGYFDSSIFDQLNILKDAVLNLWILKTGFWNDNGKWMDDKNWID
jgi:hypothetical protein